MTQRQKLEITLTALRQIRQMGYDSQAARATDTVLACIRVAEDALINTTFLDAPPRKERP